MATTVIPYNLLSNAQTGGTWTRISATGPTAPVTYDGVLNFTGFSDATYIYQYAVGESSANVTIDWQGSAADRINSTCATAFYVNSGSQPPFVYTVSDDSSFICGVQAISDDSLAPNPDSWVLGTMSGDLWYFFVAVGSITGYQIQFEVSGAPYGDDGIFGPAIQVGYHLAAGENCVEWAALTDQAAAITQQTVGTVITIPADETARIVRLRVSSVTGYEGQFDLTITGICP